MRIKFVSFLTPIIFFLMGSIGQNKILAYDFVSDGIYYNIISPVDLTCEVTYNDINNHNTYSGHIYIPSEVAYKGKTLTVTGIGHAAFFHNENITSVTIPKSVKSIQPSAFLTCSGLTKLTIPASVTYIGPQAIAYCKNLTQLIFEDGEEYLALFPVPKGDSPFDGTTNLSYLYIGRNLSSLGRESFDLLTNLKTLEIGKYVKEIGADSNNKVSFFNCAALSRINVYSANPPILNNYRLDKYFFANKAYADATVWVPQGTIDRYKGDKEWGKFWNINEGNWDSPIITSLSLSESKINLSVGDKIQLQAIVEPSALYMNISWTSSDVGVVSVDDNGNVEALQKGEAIISCNSVDGSNLHAECSIIVDHSADLDFTAVDRASYVNIYTIDGNLIFKGDRNCICLPKGVYIICEEKNKKLYIK